MPADWKFVSPLATKNSYAGLSLANAVVSALAGLVDGRTADAADREGAAEDGDRDCAEEASVHACPGSLSKRRASGQAERSSGLRRRGPQPRHLGSATGSGQRAGGQSYCRQLGQSRREASSACASRLGSVGGSGGGGG